MDMKKFINDPKDLTKELLEGFAIAHGDVVTVKSDKIICRARPKPADKVALVTLGGAGHEPALSGFVGEGALDFSVVGDIFAAPGPPKVLEALRMAKRDAGILFVVLNHAGDNTMNFANVWVAPKRNFAILVCVNQSGDTAFEATDEAVGALMKLHDEKVPAR